MAAVSSTATALTMFCSFVFVRKVRCHIGLWISCKRFALPRRDAARVWAVWLSSVAAGGAAVWVSRPSTGGQFEGNF